MNKESTAPKAQKQNLMEIMASQPPSNIPAIPQVKDRFKRMFCLVHMGGLTPDKMQKAEVFYEAEKFHFAKLVKESADLSKCTPQSLYGCWMDIGVNGLSCDPSFKQVYLVAYNHNLGTKENPKWEKRAQVQIGGPGELLLRQKQGQIKYADNPVLVYESDTFEYGEENDKKYLNHKAIFPRKSDKIIASYVKIHRLDGTIDYKVITQTDMDSFKNYSKKDKQGNLSKAWTSGEPGMWQAKVVKHAFKGYPKVRAGQFSQLQTETIDEPVEVMGSTMNLPSQIDYGMDEDVWEENNDAQPKAEEVKPNTTVDATHEVVDDDDFAKGGESQEGTVKVDMDGDDF